ncbi:hypothetical protein BDZ94DRAFT_1243026 [Collybia nuda]|uniref:Uncharacterized protein n=1 Tax=Collybia nuda TaxID=64659 RepID=A0A9P6CRK2_9AGAR|nr:hypothetical protein BDZ94DRAFT_1243026 [Collybia nuda]
MPHRYSKPLLKINLARSFSDRPNIMESCVTRRRITRQTIEIVTRLFFHICAICPTPFGDPVRLK